MKISIESAIKNCIVIPFSLLDLEGSQWIQISKKFILWQRIISNGLITVFHSFIINNKQVTVTYKEGSLDFQVLELPDSHSNRSRLRPFEHGTIKMDHTEQAVCATNTD